MHVRWHRFHSTHHPRLLPQPWEGNVPSGRHPNPTKRPLLELEVSMCGCRDSWVRVPAYCQSSGRWDHFWNQKRCSLPSKAFGSETLLGPEIALSLPSPRTQDWGAGGWRTPERTSGFCSGPWRPLPKNKLLS